MLVLNTIRLKANSSKKAWYVLQLVELKEGFAIIKTSGAKGAKGVEDGWFFTTLECAEKRLGRIVKEKTTKNSGRQYQISNEVQELPPQLSFW